MTKSRLGKKDSIFASTAPEVQPKPEKKAEAPSRSSVENKLTVILPPEQVAFLDRLALDIRGTTGWKTRRTEIIRALVAALMASGLDLTDSRSEEDITAAVTGRLSS